MLEMGAAFYIPPSDCVIVPEVDWCPNGPTRLGPNIMSFRTFHFKNRQWPSNKAEAVVFEGREVAGHGQSQAEEQACDEEMKEGQSERERGEGQGQQEQEELKQ